ncbi:tripartite tricarboxylate transporter substrate binding protein [Bacillus sp. FJAT-49705]|uniref:Tripartite tricarboxylate transporter substrate binding protein n=1 Tax=Cytobacillus citreus TaxID=2833586 RepID=A0ABS5NZN7_9BACI|nr:tripartite tricarboxylate transporter substrate binding protein [Cytobacillus citreus]MBS4192334.1 tripartite tricarboxylate transporter substrate binding protein [Cytobacillus citreus]
MKNNLLFFLLIVLVLLLSACSDKKERSDYPNKPISIIVPFAAGGGTDAVGRVLAETLKEELNQDVVVVNKDGGSGALGMNEGLNAKADGYTLTMVTREVVTLPLLGTAPFKTEDFRYISNVNYDPAVFVVSADSEINTIEDLLNTMKENPGKLKFGASAVPNTYSSQFALATDVEFQTIPYQGAAPAITEILSGGVDFGLYSPGEVKAHIEGGNLKALAVMAEDRFSGFHDVPTLIEKGINVTSGTYRGIAVPPDTPDEIVNTLEKALKKAVNSDKFVDFMNSSFLGIDYRGPEEFKEMIDNDINNLTPIFKNQ